MKKIINTNTDVEATISHICVLSILLFISLTGWSQVNQSADTSTKEKTTFQTKSKWIPGIDSRSDVAIIYGADDMADISFAERIKSWRGRGYKTAFMTGIAWGITRITF